MTPNLAELRAAVERMHRLAGYSAVALNKIGKVDEAEEARSDAAVLSSLLASLDGAQEGWANGSRGENIWLQPHADYTNPPEWWRPVLILPIVEKETAATATRLWSADPHEL